jgi:hypothetical protein
MRFLATTKALRWREGTKKNFKAPLDDAYGETARLFLKNKCPVGAEAL